MKNVIVIVALALAASLSGCAGMAFSGTNSGFIYTDSHRGEGAIPQATGTKKGEACATSILGWVTTGDSSIDTAAKAGGITTIATVDNHLYNILGLYAKYCVIVSGQ